MEVKIFSNLALSSISSDEKVNNILTLVKKGNLVVLEGRLNSEEELAITTKALESVSGKFTGIEIAFLGDLNSKSTLDKIKHHLVKLLSGRSLGITVIGPSKVIKEIKMDPNKLDILLR
jgi:hypothetical protein